MRLIRGMKRGTSSVRPEKVPHKGRKGPVLLSPYRLFVRREGNTSVGRWLRTPREVTQVREDIAAYGRLLVPCRELVRATEELDDVERAQAPRAARARYPRAVWRGIIRGGLDGSRDQGTTGPGDRAPAVR